MRGSKKILFIAIVVVILFGVFLFFKIRDEQAIEDPYSMIRQECERVGGTWEYYSNGCADSCTLIRSNETVVCTQAFTWACNCGEDKCWNGNTCESN